MDSTEVEVDMTKKLADLSKAEWAVMQAAWKLQEAVSRDIYEELKDEQGWAVTTVRTMLERLVEKGHLSRRKVGPVYVYSPNVSKPRAIKRALREVVERVLEGSVTPLVAYLLEEEDIADQDLKRLQEAIKQRAKGKKK